MTITRIPDDFTVWAFADPHGVRSGLAAALREAGLIDDADDWIASAGIALIGCGDYVDRGTDSAGLLDLLFRLRDEAAAVGSMVVLCRGNHEAMLDGVLRGYGEDAAVWLSGMAGGEAAATSFGVSPKALRSLSAGVMAAEIFEEHPELSDRLAVLVDAVIWRDVLFCHAGPVADYGPTDLGIKTNDPSCRCPTSTVPASASSTWRGLRSRGTALPASVATSFGHESHNGPEVFQDGGAIGLDTNTSGGAPGIDLAYATIARIPATGSLLAASCVLVETGDAPDRPRS
jgi:hypothetical protein